jgi:hypothetical protein
MQITILCATIYAYEFDMGWTPYPFVAKWKQERMYTIAITSIPSACGCANDVKGIAAWKVIHASYQRIHIRGTTGAEPHVL